MGEDRKTPEVETEAPLGLDDGIVFVPDDGPLFAPERCPHCGRPMSWPDGGVLEADG